MMHRNCKAASHRHHRGTMKGFGHFGIYGTHEFRRPKYNVPLNIEDKKEYYELTVFAVGFGKEQISLSVKNDTLFVKGARELSEDVKPEFIKQEFPIKRFERSLKLNGKVDVEAISAKHENGVLIASLPKSATALAESKSIVVE